MSCGIGGLDFVQSLIDGHTPSKVGQGGQQIWLDSRRAEKEYIGRLVDTIQLSPGKQIEIVYNLSSPPVLFVYSGRLSFSDGTELLPKKAYFLNCLEKSIIQNNSDQPAIFCIYFIKTDADVGEILYF